MAFSGGWWRSIGVRFLVMVMGEMVEGLKSGVSGRVEQNAVFTCGVQVFKDMEGGLVVLVARIGVVGCEEGKCWRNIWSRTRC